VVTRVGVTREDCVRGPRIVQTEMPKVKVPGSQGVAYGSGLSCLRDAASSVVGETGSIQMRSASYSMAVPLYDHCMPGSWP
jgi:hypothetical protein